jgi:hypothetical protein
MTIPAAAKRGIDDGQYIPIAELLTDLGKIFAHVTKEQAVAAYWLAPPDAVLHSFLAYGAVSGLWAEGEMALWGRLSVAGGEPILRHRRLGQLERIRVDVGEFSLIREDDGAWSVGDADGNWRWGEIRVTPRSYRTAVESARDMRRRIGEHRKAISDKALREYVNDRPTLGRPRIYAELTAAGYGVTKQRVQNAIEDRDGGLRLKGGRPSRRG